MPFSRLRFNRLCHMLSKSIFPYANTNLKLRMSSEKIDFGEVVEEDFEELVIFRIQAMRESLERANRFDANRVRERLRSNFNPRHTKWILLRGIKVGFFAASFKDAIHLEHLYVLPEFQSKGIGRHVLEALFLEADARQALITVGALRESRSNDFYKKNGFELTKSAEFDNYYVRPYP